eukprot:CAMPEP_0206240036 /NCGR_PEP_ID=MMETSP0047_2-20121206/15719_1 /ASSEMBLY_ACC=CAM_ASM_000192 /TAXON_ID=195065 /ORGANISM="Chroomonas mesostigmatica_cf, Strain CCMP1168" /LENGTH=184 /DNA_ID=CAMNT_0053664781 /DNA_START=178 /DNA_END=732 /DNA_ORIENTATION=+
MTVDQAWLEGGSKPHSPFLPHRPSGPEDDSAAAASASPSPEVPRRTKSCRKPMSAIPGEASWSSSDDDELDSSAPARHWGSLNVHQRMGVYERTVLGSLADAANNLKTPLLDHLINNDGRRLMRRAYNRSVGRDTHLRYGGFPLGALSDYDEDGKMEEVRTMLEDMCTIQLNVETFPGRGRHEL